jgi:hypothetical protein
MQHVQQGGSWSVSDQEPKNEQILFPQSHITNFTAGVKYKQKGSKILKGSKSLTQHYATPQLLRG